MNEFYTINDIATMTGLTTRTVRNYMKLGLLEGEKVDGIARVILKGTEDFVSEVMKKYYRE